MASRAACARLQVIICNGEETWNEGKCTGAIPGQLIRNGAA